MGITPSDVGCPVRAWPTEAVTLGQIQNLLINIPPRHLKSLLVSVFWPCWEWGPMRRPDLRYINSSYASNLSIRDNVKSRTLIQSGWFQAQWGSVFRLRDDQNVKVKFENYQGGFRLASYVGGGTGEGGDRLICDDPNNVTDVESDTIRNTCNEWWDLQMYNRITNVKTAARVMIMQRTHQADLSGHVLETGGWTHLKLPTRFEPSKRCTVLYAEGTKTWTDPRKTAGELLNPALWDEDAIVLGFPAEPAQGGSNLVSEKAISPANEENQAARGSRRPLMRPFVADAGRPRLACEPTPSLSCGCAPYNRL